MHNLLDNIDKKSINEELINEYNLALENPNFKAVIKNLKLKDDYLKEYT